jgi:hypothetical protein
MKRALTLALLAAVASGAAGCGGGQTDKEKIESTVRDYFTAFADSDFEKACERLSEPTREELTKAARVKSCSAALARGAQQADVRRFRTKLRDARVVSVQIKDKTATAKVRAIGATTSLPLVKEGDSWKVQGQAGEEE